MHRTQVVRIRTHTHTRSGLTALLIRTHVLAAEMTSPVAIDTHYVMRHAAAVVVGAVRKTTRSENVS